jgi:alpha-glucosidase
MSLVQSSESTLLGLPHHDGSELYVVDAPQELGGEATVRLRTRSGEAERVLLRYTQDGEPRTTAAKIDEEKDGETWWRATFPVSNPATRYRWLLGGGQAGYAWVTGAGVARTEVASADDFVITPGSAGPAWHLESVVYEIFPDRFASSGAHHDAPDWAVRKRWDELPVGRGKDNPREWFGGDLPGVEQHLDHIERVGANAIYLTPIFPAGSTHRYDATTFDRVDPLLGGDNAFHSLAQACERRGIRLIGDITTNHVGVKHDWFVAARADTHAPERSLFYFDDALPYGYEAWLGVPSLPKLDWRSDELRARMGSTLRHWLDAGLAGWRVDVANMTGRFRAVDVNHEAARFLRSVTAGALLLAEHGHDYRGDLDGAGWHGAMNYAGFLRPTWWWLRGDDYDRDVFAQAPAPRYGGAEMVDVMRRFRAGVPWDCVLHSWPLLDSHDTPRFRTVTGSRDRQLVGAGMQMTTPGVPMLFMGDELGMEGRWGEDARRPMPWGGSWDEQLLDAYGALARLRRSTPALAHGGIRYVHVSADAVAYLRETRDETLLCLAARADHDPISTPFAKLETLYGEDARDGVLPADGPAFHAWRVH